MTPEQIGLAHHQLGHPDARRLAVWLHSANGTSDPPTVTRAKFHYRPEFDIDDEDVTMDKGSDSDGGGSNHEGEGEVDEHVCMMHDAFDTEVSLDDLDDSDWEVPLKAPEHPGPPDSGCEVAAEAAIVAGKWCSKQDKDANDPPTTASATASAKVASGDSGPTMLAALGLEFHSPPRKHSGATKK